MSQDTIGTVFTINVANAIKLMPAGVYRTEIIQVTPKLGPSGDPFLAITLNVLEDLEGDDTFADRRLYGNVSTSENAKRFMGRFLMALGYTREELESGEIQLNIEELVSTDIYVRVGVTTNPNTNEEQNSVMDWVQVGYEEEAPSDDEEEEAFSPTDTDKEEPGDSVADELVQDEIPF